MSTRVRKNKMVVQSEIEAHKTKIIKISDTIHDNPELGLKEHKACNLLTSELESIGFNIENPVANLDTAFVATYKGSKKGPKVAFLAEYDALPILGHACGHNIIGASAFGAALGCKEVIDELGGTIAVYGTPDEEGKGGKVDMVEAGLFRDVDAAIMNHPGGSTKVWGYSFPMKDFTVKYLGKPAHYRLPHKGINALESLLMFLNNVNTMKRGWMPDVMFAYTIIDGGGPRPIVIPASAESCITMKAFYSKYLEDLYERVKICAKNVASIMGTEVKVNELDEYKNCIPNLNLNLALYKNFKALGSEVKSPLISQRDLERLKYPGGSSDFGNVSQVTPGIQGGIAIGPSSLVPHTKEFADSAKSKQGHEALILSAKAMAMTAVDIFADAEFVERIKKEFQEYRDGKFMNVPGIPPNYLPFPKDFLKTFQE